MTEDEMKPFVIVAIVHSVNDRQYATEADAIEDAMALAERSGYTYQVIKVCFLSCLCGSELRSRALCLAC